MSENPYEPPKALPATDAEDASRTEPTRESPADSHADSRQVYSWVPYVLAILWNGPSAGLHVAGLFGPGIVALAESAHGQLGRHDPPRRNRGGLLRPIAAGCLFLPHVDLSVKRKQLWVSAALWSVMIVIWAVFSVVYGPPPAPPTG